MADVFFARRVPRFLENCRAHLVTIRAALDAGDYEPIVTLGHNLKGTGASFGLEGISTAGANLEAAAIRRDSDAIRRAAGELTWYLDNVKVEYRERPRR